MIYRFGSRTSQGHNALPRPGLEPGSSDSEPSGVGVPAVQLTTHVKSSTLYGRLYGVKSKFFRLDGLLLFYDYGATLSFAIIFIPRQNQNQNLYSPLKNIKHLFRAIFIYQASRCLHRLSSNLA